MPGAGPPAGGGSGSGEATAPAAGLYLHVPFCSAVCPYCDFAVTVGGAARRGAFVDTLLAEIHWWAGRPEGGWRFDTVYLGGGTPSALDPGQLGQVLGELAARLGVLAGGDGGATPGGGGAWLALESNPEDVTAETLAAWRRLGVATLSLGVQSFDPAALAFLGRRHRPEDARRAVELALAAGFATVSLDLIYGLPGQRAASWRRDLEAAVALSPDHLSCYQLTVHPGTPFGRRRDLGELAELPDDDQAELFALTHLLLADAGYPAYEVSSFARHPRHRSRHNRKYWDHTPYLGLGPSAHSFGGIEPSGGGEAGAGAGGSIGGSGGSGGAGGVTARRWWNHRRVAPWRARLARGESPAEACEELGAAELALERLMLALRTPEGVDLDRFAARYGIDLEAANLDRLERLAAAGLLTLDGRRLAPTLAGLAVADGLAAGFELTPAFAS